MKKIHTAVIDVYTKITKGYYTSISWFKLQPKKRKWAVLAIGIVVLLILVKVSTNGEDAIADTKETERKVTVASVNALSHTSKDFPLVGTVTSVSEATIRSESSGRLKYVSKKLGDMIYAGGILAEFENSAEKAGVLQAEGVYEQAKATRDIAGINNNQAGSSLSDTKKQSLNTIINVYTTLDDVIRGKTDPAFIDPKFEQVRLRISVPDANLVSSLEIRRKTIEKLLIARELKNKALTSESDLITEFDSALSDTQIIKTYLDDLFTAYSKSLPDSYFSQASLEAGKTNTQTARQSVSSTIAGLVAAKTTLSASITANQVAGGQDQSRSSGAIATADAQVKQALGAYNAALSRLEKTIIRSPITGTLNSLTISTGDYISAFTQVAVVSNNGALEVVSFVTEDDARRINVGSTATIDGTVSGTVTRIASAIDPSTKKIEVRIGIKDFKSNLVNGQSVRILISQDTKSAQSNIKKSGPIIIPIAALKLTPRGGNVFTVSASNTLVSIPVQEGAILGEEIQILNGLTGEEIIVTDARGLKEGQKVEVATE